MKTGTVTKKSCSETDGQTDENKVSRKGQWTVEAHTEAHSKVVNTKETKAKC